MWVLSIVVAVAVYLVTLDVVVLVGGGERPAGAVAAGVLALIIVPVRHLLGRLVSRLDDPSPDPRSVLPGLGDRLADPEGPGGPLGGLADGLRSGWQVDSVAFAPVSDAPTVVAGRPGPFMFRTTLHAGGRDVGTVEVTAARADLAEVLRPVVTRIAGLLAVAVALAETNQEVARTRRRMIEVRREERRLLHRELHDSLAPALASIATDLAGAAEARRPDRGRVATARAALVRRAEDVRRLARAVLPTALDAGDLDAALSDLADRFGEPGRDIVVRARGGDRLADRTQLAVYFLVTEAVLDHRHHGRGTLDIGMDIRSDDVRVILTAAEGGLASRTADPQAPTRDLETRARDLETRARDLETRARDLGAEVRTVGGSLVLLVPR